MENQGRLQFGMPMWEGCLGGETEGFHSPRKRCKPLPSPFSNFATLQLAFTANGLDIPDLATLSGVHTIGVAVITCRLYNFAGKGNTDPSLNSNHTKALKSICLNPQNSNKTLPMDPSAPLKFDSQCFVLVNKKEGIFQSDAAPLTDNKAALMSRIYQKFPIFVAQFSQSMVNMGNIMILTGKAGEIQKNCHFVN